MTGAELKALIGRKGQLAVNRGEMTFTVRIKMVRERFGRVDCLVKPVSGQGEAYVDLKSIELE